MANQAETSTYSTKDLYEASFLYASGKKFIDLTKDGPQAWFVFDGAKDCDVLAKSYWAKEGIIDAKTYSEAIRSLKDILFAHK